MAPAAESVRPRTALVAGGTGALGSAVVARLLERALGAEHHEHAVLAEPDSLPARADMQMGAYLAGVAIGNDAGSRACAAAINTACPQSPERSVN